MSVSVFLCTWKEKRQKKRQPPPKKTKETHESEGLKVICIVKKCIKNLLTYGTMIKDIEFLILSAVQEHINEKKPLSSSI